MNREKRAEARGEMKENGKEKLQNNRNKASEQCSEKAAEKEEPEAPEPGLRVQNGRPPSTVPTTPDRTGIAGFCCFF